MTRKVSDLVFELLASSGAARHVFMLPGGGCMHLVDSLGRDKRFEYVCVLHEQAAAIAAEAYAQQSGATGVALVTTGPGSTNAITGVAGAWIDSTPLFVISGQAKTSDLIGSSGVRQMGIQEVDIIPMVRPVTKYAVRLMDPQSVKFEVQKALHMAMSGRKGPVWIDIPLDVQGAMVEEDSLAGFTPETEGARHSSMDASAAEILNALSTAKRPAILAGNGVRLAGAMKDFLALKESLGIPVLTTWKAADFLPEDDPHFAGRPGIVAQRAANFVQQTADFLLVLGARLDLCQTGFNHPNFAPKARKFIVDIDSSELKKLDMKLSTRIEGDAGEAIRALLRQPKLKLPDFSSWLAACKGWQRKYPVVQPECLAEDGRLVNTYALMEALSELLPSDALIVPGSSGTCAEMTLQAFKLKRGQRMQNTPGLGSMGFGLPASFGACLASGGKPTVSIIGDGGLQHNIQELETLRRLDLPIKIFILNTNGYGSILNMQNNRFDGNLVACNPASGLTLPDTCKVAAAYGLKTCRIESQESLKAKVLEVLETPGTVICDVMVDPEVQTAPRLSSKVLENGQMASLPMEDLWPFLDREELEAIMSGKDAIP